VIGAPLFKKVTLSLENGKTVVINAPQNSDSNRYIASLRYNGKAYEKNWLSHSALLRGATLDFTMSATPNKQRATGAADVPYSLSTDADR
jgi:putative alpha-1,2-mannosidase